MTITETPAQHPAPAQAVAPAAPAAPRKGKSKSRGKVRERNPLLVELGQRYPGLFGDSPLPLKRGIYEDLRQAHPDLDAEALKQALGEHTRSTRYLQGVSASQPRHDLQLQPVEPMAVEHVFHAMVEIFRRKQKRGNATEAEKAAAKEWLARRLRHSIEQSNLTAQAYAERAHTKEPTAKALLEEVTAHMTEQAVKDEALLRAFEASNASVMEFAEMYGMTIKDAGLVLARARIHQQKAQQSQGHPSSSNGEPADSGND